VKSPCAKGDFVNCLFPFGEYPDRPGPALHVVYCQRLLTGRSGNPAVVVFYTTTVLRPSDEPRRPWIIEVSEGNARKMGMQKAFAIDTHRIGVMPITADFFPDLGRPDRGVRGHATEHLKQVLDRKFVEAANDRDLLRMVGPGPEWPPRSGD
jgi:hypothetical protein